MAFTEVLCFGLYPALMDTGAKTPPAGRRMAHKRRESAGEYRDKGGHVGRPGGHKKAHPRLSQGGRWWYSRFFRRLPDNHDREEQNKQDNQEGIASFSSWPAKASAASFVGCAASIQSFPANTAQKPLVSCFIVYSMLIPPFSRRAGQACVQLMRYGSW